MEKKFDILEVVEMGIEKEKMRRDFYQRVAKEFKSTSIKDLFARLSNWEENHIDKLNGIKAGLGNDELIEFESGLLEAYWKTLINDMLYIKVDVGEFSKNIKTPLEAVSYGISFEKDSILFFSELGQHLVSKGKGVIETLIEEERSHLIYLIKLEKQLREEY